MSGSHDGEGSGEVDLSVPLNGVPRKSEETGDFGD